MARVAVCHRHTAYSGLQNSLQQDWHFMQRVTPGIGPSFQPVVEKLRDAFLLALFKVI